MKIYAVQDEEGEDGFLFATREAAVAFAGDDTNVEERIVYEDAPPTWTYWHRGASVYPDGHVDEWTREHVCRGEITITVVDDDLNQRVEPWDGHTQGHCGEHISISGTDRDGVEVAYQAALVRALARQNGKCQSRYAQHDGDIDGETVYEAGFLSVRRRGASEPFAMACYRHFAHDWKRERPDFAICRRCCTAQYSFSTTLKSTQSPGAVPE